MRVVFGLVLVLGLGLAGFAVYLVKGYIEGYQTALQEERSNQRAAVPMVNVYVAKEQLVYGARLDRELVGEVEWPVAAVPEGTFTVDAGELFADGADDRFVLRTMEPGEAIMTMKVTAPGEDAGITSRLGKGMRAFAIKVDVASGVSGFLRPGDRVDVYWTGKLEEAGKRRDVTKLIQPSLQLVAVDQTANGEDVTASIARTVTVAASPLQVAALAQAQSTGDLSLALVGQNDETEIGSVSVDQRSLLGIAEPQEEILVEKEEEVCTIRTRRGAELVEIPIPCTN